MADCSVPAGGLQSMQDTVLEEMAAIHAIIAAHLDQGREDDDTSAISTKGACSY